MVKLLQQDLLQVYEWVDSFRLSRKKRNVSRGFSDGVLIAEMLSARLPHRVDLHNYPASNSIHQKKANWETLNRKVLKEFHCGLSSEQIQDIATATSGAIELVLMRLRSMIFEKKSGNQETHRVKRSLKTAIKKSPVKKQVGNNQEHHISSYPQQIIYEPDMVDNIETEIHALEKMVQSWEVVNNVRKRNTNNFDPPVQQQATAVYEARTRSRRIPAGAFVYMTRGGKITVGRVRELRPSGKYLLQQCRLESTTVDKHNNIHQEYSVTKHIFYAEEFLLRRIARIIGTPTSTWIWKSPEHQILKQNQARAADFQMRWQSESNSPCTCPYGLSRVLLPPILKLSATPKLENIHRHHKKAPRRLHPDIKHQAKSPPPKAPDTTTTVIERLSFPKSPIAKNVSTEFLVAFSTGRMGLNLTFSDSTICVESVTNTSQAFHGGVCPGDRVKSIGSLTVSSFSSLASAARTLKTAPRPLSVTFYRMKTTTGFHSSTDIIIIPSMLQSPKKSYNPCYLYVRLFSEESSYCYYWCDLINDDTALGIFTSKDDSSTTVPVTTIVLSTVQDRVKSRVGKQSIVELKTKGGKVFAFTEESHEKLSNWTREIEFALLLANVRSI